MKCMLCGKIVDLTYYVTKEKAAGTGIKGPLVCQKCFVTTFKGEALPAVSYRLLANRPTPHRSGAPLQVMQRSPVGEVFDSPLNQAVHKPDINGALVQIAGETQATSGNYFSWGPFKYMVEWAKAVKQDRVLEYAASVYASSGGKNKPPQGPGLYLAKSIFSSMSWADTDDTCVLMVELNNVPTIDYSTEKKKASLTVRFNQMTGLAWNCLEMVEYLEHVKFSIPCVKFYGNFSVLSTGKNVVPTFDADKIKKKVNNQQIQAALGMSFPKGVNYIKTLFEDNPHRDAI